MAVVVLGSGKGWEAAFENYAQRSGKGGSGDE